MPLLGSALAMHAIAGAPPTARGKDFLVSSEDDAAHWKPSTPVCETAPGDGRCTLRAAVMAANALPGEDRIVLPPGSYALTALGSVEDRSVIGDLDVTDDLVIQGAGTDRTTIDGLGRDRILDVHAARVTISGVRLTNGNTEQVPEPGGAIRNTGELTLVGVSLSNSRGPLDAECQPPAVCDATRATGAIASTGSLSLREVTVDRRRVAEPAQP